MGSTTASYRASHLTKGIGYHAKFLANTRRRLLWSLEQHLLATIWKRHLVDRNVQHLDFACGTGRILAYFEPQVDVSVGVDVSPAMLEIARSTTQRSTFIQGDITQQNLLGNAKFDLITAFRFFPNAEPALRNAAIAILTSHLKSDGILVFNNHISTASLRRRLVRLLTWCQRGTNGMSPFEVDALVATGGLRILRTYHAGIVPESEESLWRPRWLVERIERLGTRLPVARFAENVIYVCCHR
jgi:SAM-dependent methyltransferase